MIIQARLAAGWITEDDLAQPAEDGDADEATEQDEAERA
jgi:hypothetical protein